MAEGYQNRVRVTETEDGVQVTLVGKYNAKLIEECVNAMFSCSDTNGCLEGGLTIKQSCLETLVSHNQKTQCAQEAFGLGGSRQAS
jgi:hypothetical protein